MNRRSFLATALAFSLTPVGVRAGVGTDYTPGLVERELAAGKTVFLDFSAVWCTTCRAQERQITRLLDENPAYQQAISFVTVDWDSFRDADLTRRLNIPRRSTLVVLKGDAELGRIVAGTGKAQIKDLLDVALQAASA
ncbi:MAG: thioredoxin family protein [Paracoccaceae bacterium]|nr:thioredoxin family protein [Paracoccaceae bacterium]